MNLNDMLGAAADWAFPDQAQAQRDRDDEDRVRQQRIARGQAARRPAMAGGNLQGPAQFMGFAGAAMAPGMLAHAGAVQGVNDVISREMQSRVAQAREQRRMQHEKELMAMRMAPEDDRLSRYDAMINRIRRSRG